MPDRQSRYAAFAQFYKESNALFKKYADNPKSKRLDSLYSFYVSPGGRFGGINNKIVDIFYGNRPFNIVRTLNNTKKLERASGATLSYQLTDDGYVLCTISPAFSENLHRPEDFIILDRAKNPSRLIKKTRWHWRFFQAYMESTCLDGNPSMTQKLYMVYLSCFKKYVIDDTLQKRKSTKFFCDMTKYALTVGLSGFIILAVSWFKDSDNVNQATERHQELLTTLSIISENVRSIADSVKELNESADKNHQEKIEIFNSTISEGISKIEYAIKTLNPDKIRTSTNN